MKLLLDGRLLEAERKNSMGIVIEKAKEQYVPTIGIHARNRRMIALLDSFDVGDVDQQRRDLAQLMANLAESRTGQRQLFADRTHK